MRTCDSTSATLKSPQKIEVTGLTPTTPVGPIPFSSHSPIGGNPVLNTRLTPCPLCDEMSELGPARGDVYDYKCPHCGAFAITGTAEACGRTPELRVKLAGWIRDQNRDGIVPEISDTTIKQMALRPLPGVAERADKLMLEALHGRKRLDAMVNLGEPRFVAATYSWDHQEMLVLWRRLMEHGWMQKQADQGPKVTITAEGYIAADELAAERGQSEEVFVAMSFSTGMIPAYDEGLRLGIERAGSVPIRLDRTEHVNRIDDEIIARIRKSAFVVADFTEQKSGVYFEAGFAMGLNLPVIWSCQKCDLANLHFDVRQYNCIDWEDPAELAGRLQHRIEAIVGAGPRPSP